MESDGSGSEEPGTPGADTRDSQRERNVAESLHRECIGIARLDLSAFNFEKTLRERHRAICANNVNRLERIFALQGCQRFYHENFVDVAVDSSKVELAIQSSQIDRESLKGPHNVPLLDLGPVDCLHGLHRVRAADHFFEDEAERWWVARLYAAPSKDATRRLIDAFTNAQPFTDGEIFWNVRYYTTKERNAHAQLSWLSRLTKTKQKSLKRLLKKPGFSEAFDKLLDMPGMWRPIKLGALHRLLSLGCDEEMLRYLAHVHKTWRQICGNVPTKPDVETVSRLELLCPRHASEDAALVSRFMSNRLIFGDVDHAGRRTYLLNRLMDVSTLIPTLRTFFENLKYLEPCCVIMKSLVSVHGQGSRTICRAFRKSYISTQRAFVDFAEDDRRSFLGGNNLWRSASYLQLWLYTMRHFPEMTIYTCRKEPKKPKPQNGDPDAAIVCGFARLAIDLGFPTKRARTLASKDPDTTAAAQLLRSAQLSLVAKDPRFVGPIASALGTARRVCRTRSRSAHPELTTGGSGEPISRRCGMPFEDSHVADRLFLYLPTLTVENPLPRRAVTSLFVKRDLFIGFFGLCGVNLSDAIRASPQLQLTIEPQHNTATASPSIPPPIASGTRRDLTNTASDTDRERQDGRHLADTERDQQALQGSLADALTRNNALEEELRQLRAAQETDARETQSPAPLEGDGVMEQDSQESARPSTGQGDDSEQPRGNVAEDSLVSTGMKRLWGADQAADKVQYVLILAKADNTTQGYTTDSVALPDDPQRRVELIKKCLSKDRQMHDPAKFQVMTDETQYESMEEVWAMTRTTRDVVARHLLAEGPRRVRGAMANKTRRVSSSYDMDPQSQTKGLYNSGENDIEEEY